MKKDIAQLGLALAFSTIAFAQRPSLPGGGPGQPFGFEARRPPMERALGVAPGKWWRNPNIQEKLALTPEQQKKMDEIFQDSRIKLIQLHAALQEEEVRLDPLVSSEQPDEAKILAQIDKVADARKELEKQNARMLLSLRRVLTVDQWKKLQTERPGRFGHGAHGGPGGRPGFGHGTNNPPPPQE